MSGRNSPDVLLELTREQATFLLRNCDANLRYGMASILGLADVPGLTNEERAERARPIEEMRQQFVELRRLLLRAGAVED